jgi:pyruvate/2-oxoglutarate/acetoin dehydrogenase E1 component
MGMGVGAAMTGLRPIVEGMNMGFLLLAFNQISNNCGMLHYTSGGQYKVPMVIRGPGGVGRQLGAEHSQRLESYFQSIPGVQLVAVSTVANAKALLKSVSRQPSWLHAQYMHLLRAPSAAATTASTEHYTSDNARPSDSKCCSC